MSKETKQLIKDAKQAFKDKQFQIVDSKCNVSEGFCILNVDWICQTKTFIEQEILNEDPNNYYANILLGAVYQENNPAQVYASASAEEVFSSAV